MSRQKPRAFVGRTVFILTEKPYSQRVTPATQTQPLGPEWRRCIRTAGFVHCCFPEQRSCLPVHSCLLRVLRAQQTRLLLFDVDKD